MNRRATQSFIRGFVWSLALTVVILGCATNPFKPIGSGLVTGGTTAALAGGPIGAAAGIAIGTITTWVVTDMEAVQAHQSPPPPWYLDGWVWVKLALGIAFLWFVLKYLLGQRYRENINAGFSALVRGRLPTGVKHLWTASGAKHTEKK